MSYEYYLVPTDAEATFPPHLVQGMHDLVGAWTVYAWGNEHYSVFASPEERDLRLPKLLRVPRRNDYLTASINISPKEVEISSVMDDDTDQLFYNFVTWCQAQWPCTLHSMGQIVVPETLIERA